MITGEAEATQQPIFPIDTDLIRYRLEYLYKPTYLGVKQVRYLDILEEG